MSNLSRLRGPVVLSLPVAVLVALIAVGAGTREAGAADATAVSGAAQETASTILGRQVASRVRFLASSFLEGREAGTRGERLAAEYIRDFYMGLGLSPAGVRGSFYQSFELHEKSLGEDNAFAVVHAGAGGAEVRTRYPLEEGFMPFVFSPSGRVEAPVVFAGYGISATEYGYDDYAGLDVKGSIVLVLRHEPREGDPDSPFKGLRSTKHAAFLSKVRLAQKKGATGLILVTDPANHDPDLRDPGNSLARWHSLVERGEFDTRPPPDPYQYYPEIAPDVRIPAVHVSPTAARDLLSRLGTDLETLQKEIDEKLKPASRKLPGVSAVIATDISRRGIDVRNVVARIEGSDPDLRDEFVVIGGHYDHVGYGHFGSITGAWGKIHPGADDNASGTAVIMSIAEAFAGAPERPKRTLVFIHFTAEEKGLMGSRWFVEHPTISMDKVVAMFNLDMVGRNDPSIVSVVGDSAASGLDALVKRIGQDELGLSLNNDAGSGIDRSDQWSFALKGVPSLAFFSGTHDDYHRPGDTASKIVADKLENVARLTTMAAWEVAQQGPDLIRAETTRGGE